MIGTAIGVAAVVSFAKSCLTLGSNLTEVENVVDTAFPNMQSQVDSFATNAMNKFGLSETVAKKYMGTLGAMSKSMGFTEDASYNMASAVTGLSGDVASFYNISNDEAYTKLKSIWTGETESLKDIGVVMTQTNLDQYALNNGFGKTTNAMTEQEKVALRYQYVMSSLGLAQGDFAKTSASWANQTRILSTQFDALRASIGQGLINVFTPVLGLVNSLLANLNVLAKSFSSFTNVLSGGANTTSSTGTALSQISSNAVDAASNVTGLGDATKASAAEASKALFGFDQITKIGEAADSKSITGSNSSGIPVTNTIQAVATPDTSGTEAAVAKLMSVLAPLRAINFDPLKNAFVNLGASASALAGTLWKALGWAYTNILVPLAAWTIEDFLPAFLNLLAGALDVINSSLNALQPLWQWAWDSFLQPIASWTGGAIVSVLEVLSKALAGISDWISNNKGPFDAIVITIGSFALAWKAIDLAVFITNAGGVVGIINKMTLAIKACTITKIKDQITMLQIVGLYAKDAIVKGASTVATGAHAVATGIATAATWAFNAALAVLTSPITLVVVAIAALIATIVLMVTHWDIVKQVTASVWDSIVGIWSGASHWFSTTVIQPLGAFFSGLWDGIVNVWNGTANWFSNLFAVARDGICNAFSSIGSFFSGVWGGIQNIFAGVANWFGNIFSTAWNAVKNVFCTGGEIFSGIVDGIANSFRSVVNAIISGINWVIALPFDKINGMLNSIRNVSVLGVSPFQDMWGYNPLPVPRIPMLAQGGYVKANQPQLAMIGDNRHQGEVVAPEDKLLEMATKAAQMGGSGASSYEILKVLKEILKILRELDLDFKIDGKSVKDVVVEKINQHTKATGVCEIIT